ncbi:MAG: transcription-repair coupling factor [Moraxella sp.]|nr:transcription-repair coupling factor [Moraxella sp.]
MKNLPINTPSLKANYITHFEPIGGCAKAFWLSCYVRQKTAPLVVVVTNDQNELTQLETELAFFGVQAHVFADWEILVYDQLSVHQDISSERIGLLSNMPTSGVLLVSIQTLMQRIAPPSWLLGQHFDLKVGDNFDLVNMQAKLSKAGYLKVENVFEPGEFALRGSVMDIFVMGQPLPLRLDLFDEQIDGMKFFNPETQRTLQDDELEQLKKSATTDGLLADKLPTQALIEQFSVFPAHEFPLEEGKETFRRNFASMFADTSARQFELYNDVMNGIAAAGIVYYAPLFFELQEWQASGRMFNYLPQETLFVVGDDLMARHEDFWQQVLARYHNYAHNKNAPVVAPEYLYLPSNELFAALKNYPRVVFGKQGRVSAFAQTVVQEMPNVPINHQSSQPLKNLLDFIRRCSSPVLLVAESAGRRQMLLELLKEHLDIEVVKDFASFYERRLSLGNKVALSVAPIERGLVVEHDEGMCIISETQIFGRQVLQTRRRKATGVSQEFLVKSITELTTGSLVVHIEHGIGRYQGLVVLDVDKEGEQEFIHLKYADDDSIYVPITQLSLIGRYGGTDTQAVALSKIGSGRWDKTKQKALEQIHDVAAELLNIQARRQAKAGVSFVIDMEQYELFASGFAFEETIDQIAAIEAVMFDMKQSKPMDRLICGDVGFGKTEIAMRAAFIAVQAGYQVAVLVPTTLLAGQHEDNFKNRFADWAVRIESLSRFGSKKHQEQVLEQLAQGKVDIVIGTHKLLQDDVKFHKLGLMIVDEEHRFGVRHKAKIKALQADIDSLSMTATPIPRTLNMALSGMQDISIIATPPARRLAIKTFVMQKSETTIKEAILREVLRGGQVYYLHNDVASIEGVAQMLQELVGDIRVAVAHGQMPERQLSAVMSDFYHKKYHVLVASTIIETGIDIPNANTIIINRADKFGLAQLHQLRGRVGRSHHQAYCYLLVPSIKALTSDAKKRLDAISRANTLGSGFVLASEDLEIRGAGELLGKEQSGHMQSMGFGLYMDMLANATKAIKAGKTPSLTTPLDLVSDINLHTSALIPNEYLGDVHERLLFYKRIGSVDALDELTDIRAEMTDRFGALPVQTQTLFLIHRIRLCAKAVGIASIDANSRTLTMTFRADTPVEPMAVIHLVQSHDGYRMHGATAIRRTFKDEQSVAQRAETILELLAYFAEHSKATM